MKNKYSKLSIVFLLFTFAFMVAVPFVGAVVYDCVGYYYATGASSIPLSMVHPSSNSVYASAAGQTFQPNATKYLTFAAFQLSRAGVPNGYMFAALYTIAGDFNSGTAYPDAMITYSTNLVSAMDVQGSYAWWNFTFDGHHQMISGESYAIGIVAANGTNWAYLSNQINVASKTGYAGNSFLYRHSAWVATGGDVLFIVGGSETESVDPTPAPSATPTPIATPNIIIDPSNGIWGTLAPYGAVILPLIIILVVAIICGYYGGTWGFFAGLNVAVILVYAVMGTAYMPLWALVLLGVLDVALVFGKIGR